MRNRTALATTAVLCAAAFLLSACSNARQNSAGLPPVGVSQVKTSGTEHVLYVADLGSRAIEILQDHTWAKLGTISNGIQLPALDWVDKNRHLFVTNKYFYGGGDITEYDPSGSMIFTYGAGVQAPVGVTTDRFGNVYETDGYGYVNEYMPGVDSVLISCSIGSGPVGGVAVNARDEVFVAIGKEIREFKHGLVNSHCTATTLPLTLHSPTGMAFDPNHNLLVADRSGVAVIAPPYTSITGTLGSDWSDPTSVTINPAGTRAYVTDFGASTVRVVSYPDGSTVATLGSANGLEYPYSAVNSDNFVP